MDNFFVEVEMVNGSVYTTTIDAVTKSEVFEMLMEDRFLGYLELKSFNGAMYVNGDYIISIRVTNREDMNSRFTSVSTAEPKSKIANAIEYTKGIFGR